MDADGLVKRSMQKAQKRLEGAVMREPLIYIVILNYNGYKDTEKCVESLRKIQYTNYKIVIVDNASKDNSAELIKKNLKDCTLIEAKDNTGFAGGNNVGADYAIKEGAEYVLILNNDTTVKEDFLIKLVEEFDKDEKLAVAVPKVYYEGTSRVNTFGAVKSPLGAVKNIGEGEEDIGQFKKNLPVKFVMGCCMLIKATVIKEYGLFDERFFMYLEESDFCERINKKYSIIAVAEAIIWHKNEGSTKIAGSKVNYFAKYYMRRNKLLYLDKNEKLSTRIFSKTLLYIRDFLYIKYVKRDNKYNSVLKTAWKDYKNKSFYRNDEILELIKRDGGR